MFERLFKGDAGNVFKGMLTLMVGSGLARIVGLLSIPILARIYSPEHFGVLALYAAFIAILAPLMTLRYVQAIPLPKTDLMAFNLFSICFKLIVLFSLVLSVVFTVWGGIILGWLGMEALLPWRWLIVLGAAGAALYELFSLWATRKKNYKLIARTQIHQSLIGSLAKIGIGLLDLKPVGLIFGQFLSQSAGSASLIKNVRAELSAFIPKAQRSKEKLLVKHYQDFVWFRLPSQVLMALSLQAPILMVANLYGSNITGQLSFAMIALSLPVSLIGVSMSQAYYAEVSRIGRGNPRQIKRITLEIQKKLFIAAAPIALFIFFCSEWIFVLVFGDAWRLAGEYASILSPFLLLKFTSSPLDQVFNVVGKQSIYLFINLARLISYSVVFWLGHTLIVDSSVFVFILSLVMAGHYLFVTILVVFIIESSVKKKNSKAKLIKSRSNI